MGYLVKLNKKKVDENDFKRHCKMMKLRDDGKIAQENIKRNDRSLKVF